MSDGLSVRVQLPTKLNFLMDMHRYKVVYGGRGGMKTRTFAQALLILGLNQPLRILCTREVQRSIKESVHRTLADTIDQLDLHSHYEVLETEIRSRDGSTLFIFAGLGNQTAASIKSYEGIDIVWVEEAQTVTGRSWDILIPTIRAPNSEIWISFNPDLDTDETYQRFVVNPPPNAVVLKTTYADNPWFPPELEAERVHFRRTRSAEDYDNIWEGMPRSASEGAIYTREVAEMVSDGRFTRVPYDPRVPVHTVWDLGWNDAMVVIMFQKTTPSSVNVINYLEDSGRRYDEIVARLKALDYNWGVDWLPHDAAAHNPQTGRNAVQTLRGLGRKRVRVIGRNDPEHGIRLARMLFPRAYIDSSEHNTLTGYAGPARLMECLKRYRRHVPQNTQEPATPLHDEFSHGADAWRGLATIIDSVRNDEDDAPPQQVPAFSNPIPGMGMLG